MSKPVDEFIHACHNPKLGDGTDAVVIKTHRHMEDGTVIPDLTVVSNPHRSFYVTKPGRRSHEFKKEWELVENLDRYDVPNHRLADSLASALRNGQFGGQRFQSIRQLCNSPYVYGADVHIEVLVKNKFMKMFEVAGLKPSAITTGFLDTETDVVRGDGTTPNIITVTHENHVYTAILEAFFVVKQSDGSFRRGDIEEFKRISKETLDEHLDKLLVAHVKKNSKSSLKKIVDATPFEYHYFVGKTPLDLVVWIFNQIHKNRTDFLGVWNLAFDISRILSVIKNGGLNYEDVLCPKELAPKYRYVRYVPDETESADIYKKWHWLHATSYSQFIDSMCLYRILRTVKGMEAGGMSLDNILNINDLEGKLTFKDDDPETENLAGLDWHRHMQKNEPYKYIIYNQFDCISLQLMEWKNNDLSSMLVLGGVSQLSKWTRQTRKIADSFYFYGLEDGKVMASPGQTMEDQFDVLIAKEGGAVLRPERTTGIGMRVFEDRPDIVTMLHPFTGDVDFSGMYPNGTITANISKETKISCGVEILGMDHKALWTYYSLAISLRENAVQMGKNYFGLPGYEEMAERFSVKDTRAETIPWL